MVYAHFANKQPSRKGQLLSKGRLPLLIDLQEEGTFSQKGLVLRVSFTVSSIKSNPLGLSGASLSVLWGFHSGLNMYSNDHIFQGSKLDGDIEVSHYLIVAASHKAVGLFGEVVCPDTSLSD